LSRVQHGDAVAYLPNDQQIVRDEQIRKRELVPQLPKQIQAVSRNQNIKRGDGLVAHDERGPRDYRARDRDALALTARQSSRPPLAELVERKPYERENLLDSSTPLVFAHDSDAEQRLFYDVRYTPLWIQ
jgi:hypothetical protein